TRALHSSAENTAVTSVPRRVRMHLLCGAGRRRGARCSSEDQSQKNTGSRITLILSLGWSHRPCAVLQLGVWMDLRARRCGVEQLSLLKYLIRHAGFDECCKAIARALEPGSNVRKSVAWADRQTPATRCATAAQTYKSHRSYSSRATWVPCGCSGRPKSWPCRCVTTWLSAYCTA